MCNIYSETFLISLIVKAWYGAKLVWGTLWRMRTYLGKYGFVLLFFLLCNFVPIQDSYVLRL